MRSSDWSARTKALRVFVVCCALASFGCSGDGPAPTKIHEGGGTIPEIVDQPEQPVAKGKDARKK